MKTELKELLKALDLNEIEIKVFLTNLETGPAVASVVSEAAGLNRVTTYEALKRLSKKGLVTIRAKKNTSVRYFQAEDIETIKEKLERKKEEIESTIGKAIKLGDQFQSLYSLNAQKPAVLFYEGKEGIRRVLADTLREKPKEILSFASAEALATGFENRFLDEYWQKRTALKIPSRGIIPGTPEALKKFNAERNRRELRQVRFLPASSEVFRNEIDIYGNNLSMISLAASAEYGVIIRGQNIAQSIRGLFETFWDMLPKERA